VFNTSISSGSRKENCVFEFDHRRLRAVAWCITALKQWLFVGAGAACPNEKSLVELTFPLVRGGTGGHEVTVYIQGKSITIALYYSKSIRIGSEGL
jgi:hypothetical protein